MKIACSEWTQHDTVSIELDNNDRCVPNWTVFFLIAIGEWSPNTERTRSISFQISNSASQHSSIHKEGTSTTWKTPSSAPNSPTLCVNLSAPIWPSDFHVGISFFIIPLIGQIDNTLLQTIKFVPQFWNEWMFPCRMAIRVLKILASAWDRFPKLPQITEVDYGVKVGTRLEVLDTVNTLFINFC